MAFLQLQKELDKLTSSAKLSDAVQDVDRVIDLLVAARERVAAGKKLYLFVNFHCLDQC